MRNLSHVPPDCFLYPGCQGQIWMSNDNTPALTACGFHTLLASVIHLESMSGKETCVFMLSIRTGESEWRRNQKEEISTL